MDCFVGWTAGAHRVGVGTRIGGAISVGGGYEFFVKNEHTSLTEAS